MKSLHFFILLLIGSGLSFPVFAQLEQSLRLEFKVSPSTEEYFDVTPLREDGLLVTQRQEEHFDNEKWTFYRFDVQLKQSWMSEYKLPDELTPIISSDLKI